jgi:hypothetical protein
LLEDPHREPVRERRGGHNMPRYLIERDMPGAGSLSPQERQAGSKKSCEVVAELAPRLQWEHSYYAGDKVYCVYIADSEEPIREHGERGGYPITAIHRVDVTTDPTTAEV